MPYGGGSSIVLNGILKKPQTVGDVGNGLKSSINSKNTAMNNSSSSNSSNNGTPTSFPRISKTLLTKIVPKPISISSLIALPDPALEVFGGILTWSLLTMTSENQNEGGTLISLPRGAMDRGTSAKREIWCVLIDKMFYNFASYDSLKPRLHADLKSCYITPMDAGVFSIDENDQRSSSYSFKTLYFMGKNRKEGAKWFWKLYTQSASNSILRYSNLNFNSGRDTPFS